MTTPQLHIANHPLVAHHLAALRQRDTSAPEFRRLINRLSMMVAYEATGDLRLESIRVETPLATTTGRRMSERIGLVPILRAGLSMVDAVVDLLPDCEIWHLGLYRDEETAMPISYYSRLPEGDPVARAFVLDPMLATGGSAVAACSRLFEWGVGSITMAGILGAPEGVARLADAHPEVAIYLCALDERLNEQSFIVPGLGDAGDRSFNTSN